MADKCLTKHLIIDAAEKGDVARIQALIAAGADVDSQLMRESCRGGPLVAAIRGGHVDAVLFLLDAGANPQGVGTLGQAGFIKVHTIYSPLRQAESRERQDIVGILRERGATR